MIERRFLMAPAYKKFSFDGQAPSSSRPRCDSGVITGENAPVFPAEGDSGPRHPF